MSFATFAAIQAILLLWWAAFYPGLFSRDSVLYLSHTLAGPWVSDHSVLYDALMWLSFTVTGDLGAVTLLQTTAMAAALTFLAQSLKRLGSPPRSTTVLAIVLPLLPPVGAFTVALWKDVPFTICAITIAAVACRGLDRRNLLVLGALFVGLGLFRANGFLVVAVAVVVLLLVVRTMRVRLALTGLVAAVIPLGLNNVAFPAVGITAPSATYVYHTAFADLAYAFHERPGRFQPREVEVLSQVAPLSRWWQGGSCATVNPLIWRKDFSWQQAEVHSAELLNMWKRLLLESPGQVIDARLCRGAIAWRIAADAEAEGGLTYHFSRRPTADEYVGPDKVTDFPGREVFTLRTGFPGLYGAAYSWLDLTYRLDWLMWRGALWSYLTYLALGLAAIVRRRRAVLAAGAIVMGQQLAVLANISAQDFRYMASPIFIGMLLLPLLVSSTAELIRRRRARRTTGGVPLAVPQPRPEPLPLKEPAGSQHWRRLPVTGGQVLLWRAPHQARRATRAPGARRDWLVSRRVVWHPQRQDARP
ncbi:hypothetical protein ACIBG7_04225 [Nonomuraea sp. NPDC050328]|uniref:hypothetical protein n=1 Tax=Nonomuraea sp. NPDC050328 TaxID=3364361 RepID=UPI0037A69524